MSPNDPSIGVQDLALRSSPAPIRRFSKKALAVVLGGASAIVLGSFALAMSGSRNDTVAPARELYSTANKPTAAGLANLPVSYAEVDQKPDILGPPLPGDLGAPILKAQREGRLDPQPSVVFDLPRDDAAVEAIEREAERTEAARQSGLFFTNAAENRSSVEQAAAQLYAPAAAQDPFAALKALQIGPQQQGYGGDPNYQDRKADFVAEKLDRSIYNPYQIETPASPWQVMAGTVIPATLLTAINSDLPGQVVGQVTEPVYDTVTGQTVLIPQGSRIIGRYDSVVAYGQSRALVVWNRIIMPDGTSIRIENLPGVDGRGNAGLKDRVNNHSLRIFSAAALSSLISIGAELSDDEDDRIASALRDAAQDGASQVGNEVIRRQLAVQPTITIRPGWRLRILVHQDIILQPYGGG